MYNEDYELYDRILTFDELSKEVDEEWELMSEEERYGRIRDNDPTFLTYCLSYMGSKKINKIIINEYTYDYEEYIDT